MKKRIVSIVMIVVMFFVVSTTVYAADDRFEGAKYGMVVSFAWADMGIYAPGQYVISCSTTSDAGSNILDSLSFVCDIPLVSNILPCQYVDVAEYFLKVMPETTFEVRLKDPVSGSEVWSGELTSGVDELWLGEDHESYKVELKAKNNTSGVWVYLAKR